jgi:hypothetical protein
VESYKFKRRQLSSCRPTTEPLKKTIDIWSKFEATTSGTAYKNLWIKHQHDRVFMHMFT